MRERWASAPRVLKTACVLGVPWYVVGLVIGIPLLVLPGPGLPVIALGMVGAVPWIVLLTRSHPPG